MALNCSKPWKATEKQEAPRRWKDDLAGSALQTRRGVKVRSICCKTCYLEHNLSSREDMKPLCPPIRLPLFLRSSHLSPSRILLQPEVRCRRRAPEKLAPVLIFKQPSSRRRPYLHHLSNSCDKNHPPMTSHADADVICEVRREETCDISSKRATPAHKHKVVASFLLCRVLQGPLLVARQPGTAPLDHF